MPTVNPDTTYTGAWNEAMRRVIARDNIILGYVAVSGTLLGLALKTSGGNSELALVVPIVTLVAGALVAHHDFLISLLNRYLRQFGASDFTPWHKQRLRLATTVGLILHTLPVMVAAALFTHLSLAIAQSSTNIPNTMSEVQAFSPYAGWTGTILLALGRIAQVVAALKKSS